MSTILSVLHFSPACSLTVLPWCLRGLYPQSWGWNLAWECSAWVVSTRPWLFPNLSGFARPCLASSGPFWMAMRLPGPRCKTYVALWK